MGRFAVAITAQIGRKRLELLRQVLGKDRHVVCRSRMAVQTEHGIAVASDLNVEKVGRACHAVGEEENIKNEKQT